MDDDVAMATGYNHHGNREVHTVISGQTFLTAYLQRVPGFIAHKVTVATVALAAVPVAAVPWQWLPLPTEGSDLGHCCWRESPELPFVPFAYNLTSRIR